MRDGPTASQPQLAKGPHEFFRPAGPTISFVCFAFIASAVTLAIFGCTQLEVRRYSHGTVEGIPYVLPNKAFLVAIDYEIKDCSYKSGKLLLDVKKTVAVTQIVEPGESFYIPYSSISNVFKDTDVVVEAYDNSTLKGLSIQVTDKTGPAIASILGSVLRVATLTASPPKPAAAATDQFLRGQYCSEGLVAALDKIAGLKAGTQTEQTAGQIEAEREALKFKQVAKWSPAKDATNLGQKLAQTTVYPEQLLDSHVWVTAAGLKALRDDNAPSAIDPKYPIEKLVTHITIDVARPIEGDPAMGDVLPGLVVRNPAQGLLRTCDQHCPRQEGVVTGVVGAADVTIPQLGTYIVLPLKNRIFQDQKIDLALSETGALQKIGITSKATAAAAADSFNTNFDQFKAFRDARDKAKNDARTAVANQPTESANRTAEVNQALASCFAAQRALQDAGGVPVGTCQ